MIPYIGIWLCIALGICVVTGRDKLAAIAVIEIFVCWLLL